MRPICQVVSLVALLCLALSSQAQVFKTVDEDGNVTFSDRPAENSTEVEIQQPNTVSPVEAPSASATAEPREPELVDYAELKITSPADQQIIPNGRLPLTVFSHIEPSLREGHQVRLLINGEDSGTNRSGVFNLERLYRGTHTMQLEVLDNGRRFQTSDVVTVYSRWPGGR